MMLPNSVASVSSDSTSWFPALRSKFSSFSMSEWLVSLGLSKRKSSNGDTEDRKATSAPTTREHSVEPVVWSDEVPPSSSSPPELGPIVDDDLLTPLAEGTAQDPWELPNFWLNLEPGRSYTDTLDLQHFGPLEGLMPTGKKQLGVGHEFHVTQLVNPTWCDKCGDFIWGFYKQAVHCKNCNYTCHYKCRMLVTLDCRALHDSIKSGSTDCTYLTAKSVNLPVLQSATEPWPNGVVGDDEDELIEEASPLDWPNDNMPHGRALVQAIDLYNQSADGLGMTLIDDIGELFSGYLQIHMNFTRPINVVAGQRPPSMYDVMKEDSMVSDSQRRTITSFFLPRNTVKTVHITSHTTTRELIISLLRKFKVADNPLKFALYTVHTAYAHTIRARLQRLSDDVCPLRLELMWGSHSGKQLVLQENETGDVLWDAFEIPELNNFLKILELEEQQYIWQIRQRYNLYKHYLELEIRNKKPESEWRSEEEKGSETDSDQQPNSSSIVWEQRGESTVKVNGGQLEGVCTCENGGMSYEGEKHTNHIDWEEFENV